MNAPSPAEFEPVVGRYLKLNLLGKPHRLYVEESGEGIPLLCLHTAGSDSRQYRAVMNDASSDARKAAAAATSSGSVKRRKGMPLMIASRFASGSSFTPSAPFMKSVSAATGFNALTRIL